MESRSFLQDSLSLELPFDTRSHLPEIVSMQEVLWRLQHGVWFAGGRR
jgi:hypothetical protein